MPLVKTSTLTRGERLVLARRREDRSQIEAAKRFGVSLYHYRGWETGTRECPHELPLGKLEDFEACFITRRRKGLRAGAVAKKLGCSRWWFCLMEQGQADAKALVAYWRGE